MKNKQKFLWLDTEWTGVQQSRPKLLEVAAILTDADLNVIISFEAVIKQPKEVLQSMDPWCIETHGKSGLTAACQQSNYECSEAGEHLLQYVIKPWTQNNKKIMLAGFSVHFDQTALKTCWPQVVAALSHRVMDITSLSYAMRAAGVTRHKSTKASHRAMDDVKASMDVYRHYRKYMVTT